MRHRGEGGIEFGCEPPRLDPPVHGAEQVLAQARRHAPEAKHEDEQERCQRIMRRIALHEEAGSEGHGDEQCLQRHQPVEGEIARDDADGRGDRHHAAGKGGKAEIEDGEAEKAPEAVQGGEDDAADRVAHFPDLGALDVLGPELVAREGPHVEIARNAEDDEEDGNEVKRHRARDERRNAGADRTAQRAIDHRQRIGIKRPHDRDIIYGGQFTPGGIKQHGLAPKTRDNAHAPVNGRFLSCQFV